MPDMNARARRWRAAAVAVVLVAGGIATVATTPPLERCPESTTDVTPSAFFGDQEYDDPRSRFAEPSTGEVAGLVVSDAQVRVPSCVAAAGSTARVTVSMDYEPMDPAATGTRDVEDVGDAMRLTDGDGATWPAGDASAYPAEPAEDGAPARPAHLVVSFDVPIDVVSPVDLHLGGPDDDVLALAPTPSPSSRSSSVPAGAGP